jgi:hypothetical protein
MSDAFDDEVLTRLKKLVQQLDHAKLASAATTKVIEQSRRTTDRASKAARLVDTSKKRSPRKRRARKKR